MFDKLEVHQKSVDFADEIASLTEGFPRGCGILADQLNRAALSIATNLAEGNGRFTKPDAAICLQAPEAQRRSASRSLKSRGAEGSPSVDIAPSAYAQGSGERG